jgi:4'-phosphopantetheinyl transferase
MHFIEIRLGSLPTDAAIVEHLQTLLDADELRRAASFKNPVSKQRYIAVRGLLRRTLAEYLDRDAASLGFTTHAHGKPVLIGTPLHFNLSHSADKLAIAVSTVGEVGVDIEQIRPRPGLEEIARRCFSSQEFSVWQATPEPERQTLFYRLWTKKEAFVKAVGRGLALGLELCELDMTTGQSFLHIPAEYGEAADWQVQELVLEQDGFAGFCGAVVAVAGIGVGNPKIIAHIL